MIQVYHNPRCSKSRECILELDKKGIDYEIIHYLKSPISIREIKELVKKLGIKPIELVRIKEPAWEKYKDKKLSPAKIMALLAKNPILIERPIVVVGEKAVIARPLEKINEII